MASPLQVVSVGVDVLWIVAIAAAAVAVWYLYKWLRKVYDQFMDVGSTPLVDRPLNLFYDHDSSGQPIAPPKGTDPIDWIFMNHDDPT